MLAVGSRVPRSVVMGSLLAGPCPQSRKGPRAAQEPSAEASNKKLIRSKDGADRSMLRQRLRPVLYWMFAEE